MYQSQATHQLGGEVAFLRAECGASREGDAFGAVDDVAVSVRGDERGITRTLHVLRDLPEGEVPRDGLPGVRSSRAILWRFDAARRGGQLHRRRTLRAEAAFVDWAVGVAFDLEELHRAIALLAGVGDERTADRAVGADRVRFLGARNPEGLLDLGGLGEGKLEAQARGDQGASPGNAEFQNLTKR